MSKNYREITAEVSASLAKLRADMPETLRGFSSLAQAAGKDGALDKKTKELIAMALSVPLVEQLRPMRIDHHGWQILLAMLIMAQALRPLSQLLLLARRQARGTAQTCG